MNNVHYIAATAQCQGRGEKVPLQRERNRRIFFEKVVDISSNCWYTNKAVSDDGGQYGGVAHLGERLHGMQEVRGSIPLISTKNTQSGHRIGYFLFYDRASQIKKRMA